MVWLYRMDLNFRGTKLSRMAVEPRKPRKFSTAKIKVHTVYVRLAILYIYICIYSYMPNNKLQPFANYNIILIVDNVNNIHTCV